MSRKHYTEVQFSSPVTVSTSVYKFCAPYGGRASFGEPLKFGNWYGKPITCVRGYLGKDSDSTTLEFQMRFAVNGVTHEEVLSLFATTNQEVIPWTMSLPLTLNDTEEVTCELRSPTPSGTGTECFVVMIFEWDGDLP